MLKKILILITSLLMLNPVFANIETVQKKLKEHYPQLNITNIQVTEMQGLYSANLDQQIIYLNEDAQHIFIGSMIRLRDQHNLTKDLVDQAQTTDFNKLPLKDAIKTIRGNGKRQIAIFSDPNCPYCKTLERNLATLTDVTLYTFMYPIKAQSILPAQQVWCSDNPAYAWKQLIQNSIAPTATATCENPIKRNLALGQQLGLQGTPAMIFANGKIVMGAYPTDKIEKILTEMQ